MIPEWDVTVNKNLREVHEGGHMRLMKEKTKTKILKKEVALLKAMEFEAKPIFKGRSIESEVKFGKDELMAKFKPLEKIQLLDKVKKSVGKWEKLLRSKGLKDSQVLA